MDTTMPKPFEREPAVTTTTTSFTTNTTLSEPVELREEEVGLTPEQIAQRQAEEEHLRLEAERVQREEEEALRIAEEERLKRVAEYRQELLKVQDEIVTLRQVLNAKLKRETELKGLLNIGFMEELKQDWAETLAEIKSMAIFKRSHATYNATQEKVGPAAVAAGTHLKTGVGHLRNTQTFKSFEEKLGTTTGSLSERFGTATGTFSEKFGSAKGAISDKFGSTTSTMGEKFGSTMNAVKSKVSSSKSSAEISQTTVTPDGPAATSGGTTFTTNTTLETPTN